MRLVSHSVPSFSTAAPPRCSSRAVRPLVARSRRAGRSPQADAAVGVPLALAAVLLSLAMLVAPEQPTAQEAICHRHNGAEACRVW